MRLTDFWQRMDEVFGAHAAFVARDQVLTQLGNRTATEALAAGGVDPRGVARGLRGNAGPDRDAVTAGRCARRAADAPGRRHRGDPCPTVTASPSSWTPWSTPSPT